jgi:hypothetical protein
MMTGAVAVVPAGPWMCAAVVSELNPVYEPVTVTDPVPGSIVSVAVPTPVLGLGGTSPAAVIVTVYVRMETLPPPPWPPPPVVTVMMSSSSPSSHATFVNAP